MLPRGYPGSSHRPTDLGLCPVLGFHAVEGGSDLKPLLTLLDTGLRLLPIPKSPAAVPVQRRLRLRLDTPTGLYPCLPYLYGQSVRAG